MSTQQTDAVVVLLARIAADAGLDELERTEVAEMALRTMLGEPMNANTAAVLLHNLDVRIQAMKEAYHHEQH